MLLTLSNLYPRPDQPQRGLFNAQLFQACRVSGVGCCVRNVCLVPEWRVWRWRTIRAWQDPCTRELSTRYVPVGYVPLVGRSLSGRTYTLGLKSCANEFGQCAAVLATWLYPDGVAAAELARRAGKPIWLKVHGTDRFHVDHSARRQQILAACEDAEGIICNSRFIVKELVNKGLPEAKLHVIPNGIDTTLFRYRTREEAEKDLAAVSQINELPDGRTIIPLSRMIESPNHRIILFIGNLVPVKGPDLLLKAWTQVITSRISHPEPGISHTEHRTPITDHLLFLGSGPMLPVLKRQAKQLGIADHVTFLGSRPHAEIALWMNVADGLCLPSRSEGMPNVVLEALASGLPVVATDVGDCRRVLADEPASRVVPVDDPEAMADALKYVLTSDWDRSAMAGRCQSRLSWEECARRHLEMMMAARW